MRLGTRDEFVYTEDRHRGVELEREVAAARQAGIDAALTAETDLPYPVHGAVKVEGQAQFHPRRYLLALADCVEGDGSSVHEQTGRSV